MKKILLLVILLASTLAYSLQAQNVTLTGQVKDKTTGETLPGANILVVGTEKGTITDVNGKYSLELPAGLQLIQASYVGYAIQATVHRGERAKECPGFRTESHRARA